MRKAFITLGFISSVLSLILAVSLFYKSAYFSIAAAVIFGLVAYYVSKRQSFPQKAVYLILLLTGIALFISAYKTIFHTREFDHLESIEINKRKPKELLNNESFDELNVEDDSLKMNENDADIRDIPLEE